MTFVVRFFRFWYDFIVGDDWRIALGVVVSLGVSAALVHLGVPAWWVVPLATIVILVTSLLRTTRSSRRAS